VNISGCALEVESALRELLPLDLPETLPIYAIGRKDLCALFDYPGGAAMACTGNILDLRLRPILQAHGEWKGRGFAFIVYENRFDLFRSCSRVFKREVLLNVALHEAAHFITFNECRGPEADLDAWTERDRDAAHRLLATLFNGEATRRGEECDPLRATMPRPFEQHDMRFIRASVHIIERATARGHAVDGSTEALFSTRSAGPPFGTSDYHEYREAFADEPDRFKDVPIVEILKTPPPEAALKLWRADVCRLEKIWRRARLAANWCPEVFSRKENHAA